MRLTRFTDFGLRALMRLAAEPARTFTTDEIATAFAISRNHLTKVVRNLAGAGFVMTRRGAGGGFRLARPAEGILIGEVVRSLEARQALVECFRVDGGCCVLKPGCKPRAMLRDARESFYQSLDRQTLADCVSYGRQEERREIAGLKSPRRSRVVKSRPRVNRRDRPFEGPE